MAIYGSSNELYDVMLPFYREILADDVVGQRFANAGVSFKIRHTDPHAVFVLDASQPTVGLLHDAQADAFDADVELTMSADDGHSFWLGQLNLPMALARKKVKVDGGVTRLLGLVPALAPAYAMYAEYLRVREAGAAS